MIAKIQYFNVVFSISLENEVDMNKFSYIAQRIRSGEHLMMRDIYGWCHAHRIAYTTHFCFRKDYPVSANLWNFYNYVRAKIEMEREKRVMTIV